MLIQVGQVLVLQILHFLNDVLRFQVFVSCLSVILLGSLIAFIYHLEMS